MVWLYLSVNSAHNSLALFTYCKLSTKSFESKFNSQEVIMSSHYSYWSNLSEVRVGFGILSLINPVLFFTKSARCMPHLHDRYPVPLKMTRVIEEPTFFDGFMYIPLLESWYSRIGWSLVGAMDNKQAIKVSMNALREQAKMRSQNHE